MILKQKIWEREKKRLTSREENFVVNKNEGLVTYFKFLWKKTCDQNKF
jgi:hypothetical protein